MAFQLTRSRGAWLGIIEFWFIAYPFQLTRSRGAWLSTFLRIKRLAYFNSHAHVERDHITPVQKQDTEITTHTLTWSVTSVHTLSNWLQKYYNSHAHVERDYTTIFKRHFRWITTHTLTWSVTEIRAIILLALSITTHTLTWSVTGAVFGDYKEEADYNSHAHVERDLLPSTYQTALHNYNSHAHVERDLLWLSPASPVLHYNSHAHVERDIMQ